MERSFIDILDCFVYLAYGSGFSAGRMDPPSIHTMEATRSVNHHSRPNEPMILTPFLPHLLKAVRDGVVV